MSVLLSLVLTRPEVSALPRVRSPGAPGRVQAARRLYSVLHPSTAGVARPNLYFALASLQAGQAAGVHPVLGEYTGLGNINTMYSFGNKSILYSRKGSTHNT